MTWPSGKKYRTIMADPPWPYYQRLGTSKLLGHTTTGGVPYPTMSIKEIMALPVREIADGDCQLWLWATNSHLHDAFHVMEAWGFRYVTTLTWVKTQMGLGYWLRGMTEHCLLGVRGSPRAKLQGPHGATGNDLTTILYAPRGKHSAKPEEMYARVEAMSEEPRIELFARKRVPGWDAWGNEVSDGAGG
jgi:N6-adenosine-specific RNA methylase IME4